MYAEFRRNGLKCIYMKLYHGSYLTVDKPDIRFSRNTTDFGRGFYTTPLEEQAAAWAKRFKRKKGASVISIYELNETELKNNAVIKPFYSYNEEWLEFVLTCRSGKINENNFDIIIGGVANDNVFDTVQLVADGLIPKSEALKRLSFQEPNIQYCFRSQTVIDKYLRFILSYESK
ncbi:hypothetical protein FACS189427_07370 [Planctomycetales bacterium]|nr:hypothetical protein FACS189427_07370 [Planctomycetales bacterium]